MNGIHKNNETIIYYCTQNTYTNTNLSNKKKKNTTSAKNIIELINIIILIIFWKNYQKRNKKEKIARTKQMKERLLYKF